MSDAERDVRVRLDMLEKEAVGLQLALAALALRLSETPEAGKATRELLDATAIYAEVDGGAAAGMGVRSVIRHLAALQDADVSPVLVLLAAALQQADAGEHRRSALAAWHAQASDDELTEELVQLLQKYGLPVPGVDDLPKAD